jgi:hypothetical protein
MVTETESQRRALQSAAGVVVGVVVADDVCACMVLLAR